MFPGPVQPTDPLGHHTDPLASSEPVSSDPAARRRPRAEFPDRFRTNRSHAGELIEDGRNWPGIILIFVGVVAAALTLTAAGYGFAGWAVIAAIVTVVCLIGGTAIVLAEHRRVKAKSGDLPDPGGH
ncbi:hypothetical protein [Nocardia sp. JCM 34519.1]|uniref:hypothetical protein n=1 Tax=unclassified Nocardia TaxID=2637762 RepID=UPI0035A99644